MDFKIVPTTCQANLPIENYKSLIVNTIKTHRITIIEGPTGCGKTTQVPQYVFDDCVKKQTSFNIIVTQPRRIAAISIAERVASEREWKIGSMVGYQVGLDKKVDSESTRLLYCTIGVLLQKIIAEKNIERYTHIFIDEVHERSEEVDLLLMIIKILMREPSSTVKIILMSATFNVEDFQNYFAVKIGAFCIKPQVISVEQTVHHIDKFYLDDLQSFINHDDYQVPVPLFERDNPRILNDVMEVAIKLVMSFDQVELRANRSGHCGAVLVFLPGLSNITEMKQRLENRTAYKNKWWILPFHRSITSDEQRQVFQIALPGMRKIILATNIAESSITIRDVEYVIDFCLSKHLVCDTETHFPVLQLEWASKISCRQRAGRTGRVKAGFAFRMVSKEFYDGLSECDEPEILRSPLELSILRVKRLDLGTPKGLLNQLLDPPILSDIRSAVLRLKQAGALTAKCFNSDENFWYYDDENGNLTQLGDVMARLPIDIRLSKLIVIGYTFDVLEECVIMASCATNRDMLQKRFSDDMNIYKSRLCWADGTFSDLFCFENAYRMFKAFECSDVCNGIEDLKKWCNSYYIDYNRIKDVELLYDELQHRLHSMGIVQNDVIELSLNEKELLLKVAISGAFYPNYFIRREITEESIYKMISYKDPCSTVQISGLPQNQGYLYTNQLKKLFKSCSSRIDVEYEETKALITFLSKSSEKTIGTSNKETLVKSAVYLALKMGRLRGESLEIEKLSPNVANDIAQTIEMKMQNSDTLRSHRVAVLDSAKITVPEIDLPGSNILAIKISVTHVINAGHFYSRYADLNNFTLTRLNTLIESSVSCERTLNEIGSGDIVLFGHTLNNSIKYYRALVQNMTRQRNKCLIFCVDFGCSHEALSKDLIKLDVEVDKELFTIPAQAFECKLSAIKPSASRCLQGIFDEEANDYFKKLVAGQILEGQIYSVIWKMVRLELSTLNSDLSINDLLVKKGYAERSRESLASQLNFKIRLENRTDKSVSSKNVYRSEDVVSFSSKELAIDESNYSFGKLNLKGPRSPIEAAFSGMTSLTKKQTAIVEFESVNSIVLEPDYNSTPRLLVAGSVQMSQQGQRVIIRDTTLMPNIRGFAHLVILLFAPKVELRIDSQLHQYIGAKCGLGYHSSKKPYDAENDIDLVFDSDISREDIININLSRVATEKILNLLLNIPSFANDEITKQKNALRKNVLDLLKRYRRSKPEASQNNMFDWDVVPPSYRAELPDEIAHPAVINPLKMSPFNFCDEVRKNLILMGDLITKKLLGRKITCLLCKKAFFVTEDIMLHLNNFDHVLNLKEFEKVYLEEKGKPLDLEES